MIAELQQQQSNVEEIVCSDIAFIYFYAIAEYLMSLTTCVRRRSSLVVHHKVSGSNIPRTVGTRIIELSTDNSDQSTLYSRIEYDVTNYFRSEVLAKKTDENAESDGFGWNFSRTVYARITKFHNLAWDVRCDKPAGYGITNYFRSAAKYN